MLERVATVLLILAAVFAFPVTAVIAIQLDPQLSHRHTVQTRPTPPAGLVDWSTVQCVGGEIGGQYREVCGDAAGHYVSPATAHEYGK